MVRIVPVKFMLLKHTAFQPQVAAALTVNSGIGMLTEVHDILDGKIGVGDELSYRLANAVNVDISHGRVAEVSGAWNESKFSYILLVDVYLNNEKIREEIYQGYTDRVDTLERSLINVATTTVDPTTMCFINKQMHISFTTNDMGRVIPKFHQPSSVLTDTSYSQANGDLQLVRPFDVSLALHGNSITQDLAGIPEQNIEVVLPASTYGSKSRCSKLSNNVGGKYLSSIIAAAAGSKLNQTYGIGSNRTSAHEDMLASLSEVVPNQMYLLKEFGKYLTRSNPTSFTLKELNGFLPGLETVSRVFTVESFKDRVTKETNSLFNFSDNEIGDSTLTDNTITRFQKRIVDYLFDSMLTLGFVSFSGTMTNKTMDGGINLQHSYLENISETVNRDEAIRVDVMRLLYSKLCGRETVAILNGGVDQDVELVFDLSLYSSNVMININGVSTYVKIPSLCDGSFSSMLSGTKEAGILMHDLGQVVDSVLTGVNTVRPIIQPNEW